MVLLMKVKSLVVAGLFCLLIPVELFPEYSPDGKRPPEKSGYVYEVAEQ
jgi:hypothetical protein